MTGESSGRPTPVPTPTPVPSAPSAARDLVVAFAFVPFVDTAAVVAAKRVREAGRPVDVIQNEMSTKRATDPTLDQIAGGLVRRRAMLRTPTLFSSWKGVPGFTEPGLAQALEWDADGPGYDRVYSRAHWVPSHFLAAQFTVRRPQVRWTAEFSDPLSLYVDARERFTQVEDGPLLEELGGAVRAAGFDPPGGNLFTWVETLPYALADELVFTNDNQRDLMLGRIADPALAARARERASVRPHPTLPPEFYQLTDPRFDLEPGRVHLGYFGNFYATRGLGTVLTALRELPAEVRDRLQLNVFTAQPADLEGAVRDAGLGDTGTVRARPFVGYLDFLALSTRMDALLLNDAVTSGTFAANPFLPSKWSDYRGSGRPVWGIVEHGSPLSTRPLDHRTPVNHVTAAMQVLTRLARA